MAGFGCVANSWMVSAPQGGTSTLYSVDLLTGKTSAYATVTPRGIVLNAIGYNALDGTMWGHNQLTNKICKINPDGVVQDLSLSAPPSSYGYVNGDVDSNGYFYFAENGGVKFYVVDVNPSRATFGQYVNPANGFQLDVGPRGTSTSSVIRSSDFAFNPQDGQLYGVNETTGALFRLNPTTGVLTNIGTLNTAAGTIGATWFDKNNNFYGINFGNGQIYKYAISGNSATRSFFSQGITGFQIDGTRCSTAPISYALLDTTKRATPYVAVGDTITYTITIANTGNQAAANTTLIDTIPNGTSFVPNSIALDGTAVTGSPAPPSGANLGSLGIGNHTVTFSVVVTTLPNPNPVPNQAQISYQYTDGGTTFTNNTNTNIPTTTVVYANLVSAKSASATTAKVGDTVTYTITLTNTGNVSLFNIRFIDTIPNGATYQGLSLAQDGVAVGGIPNPPGVLLPNPIAAGNSSVVTFKVTLSSLPNPNPMPNRATSNYQYAVTPGAAARNGSSNSNTVFTNVLFASLSGITKAVDKTYAAIGETLTYTITVPNTGVNAATNVVITDPIPANTAFIPSTVFVNNVPDPVTAPTNNIMRINIGSLQPNQIGTLTFSVKVTTIPNPNPIYDTASASSDTTTQTANSNTVATTILGASLSSRKVVNKSLANVGDVLVYTIALTNSGNAAASNINFQDIIPNGTTLIPGTFLQDITPLSGSPNPPGVTLPNAITPGQTSFVVFNVTITSSPSPNPIPNSAAISYQYNSDPTKPPVNANTNTNTTKTIVPGIPPYTLVKTGSKNFATIGDILTYTLTFTNSDPGQLTNAYIVDTIPDNTVFVPGSVIINNTASPSTTAPNGILTANMGNIAPNGLATLVFNVRVTSLPNPNPIPNIAALSNDEGKTYNSNVFITTVVAAILDTTKSVTPTNVKVGDTIFYTVTIVNTGNTTATNVLFIDTVPSGTSFKANSLFQNGTLVNGNPNPPGANLPQPIAAGATSTITFSVVANTIPTSYKFENIGSLFANFTVSPTQNGSTSDNTNTVITYIGGPDLSSISKSVDKTFVTCGDNLTYTITIPNKGNLTATNVVFIDTIPNGTTLVPNSVFVNGSGVPNANPTTGVTIPNIVPNSSAVISFKVLVNC